MMYVDNKLYFCSWLINIKNDFKKEKMARHTRTTTDGAR